MALTGELYEAVVRIIDQRVGEIKVTREDFDRLTKTVSELGETVRELAEAQKRTEEGLGALAEAQKRTEEALRELAEAQKRTDQAVGRLTDTIGHDLESIARVSAPNWLQVYEDVKVPGLERRVFKVDGEEVEINLYGEGMKGRTPVAVVGEAKSTIHGRDVEAFSARVDRLKGQLRGGIIKLMLGYWIHPSAEQQAKKLQVHVIAPPGTYPTAKPAKRK